MRNTYRIIAGICALATLSSCNYENLNTNPYEMSEEMGARDGIAIGGAVTAMEKCVFPVGTQADDTDIINAYQTSFNLSADTWSGYFGQNNYWDNGQNNTLFFLKDAWCASTYTQSYTNLLASWKKIKMESEKLGKPEWLALGNILKISAWSKTVESFGPIPYTHAGETGLVIPSDSEKDIFTAMLSELESAVETLTPLAGSKLFAEYDAVYAGDVTKWIKYANSLMLRLAMTVSYADEQMAKDFASKAVSQKIGLISVKEEEAQMSNGAGLKFVNNINWLASNYNETRMGASIYCYLNGYEDPRLETYFTESTSRYAIEAYNGKKYLGLSGAPKYSFYTTYFADASMPNFTSDTPTYWLRASEVCFLMSEAALRWGGEFGDAGKWYRDGIAMSFAENGITADVDSYMSDEVAPAKHSSSLASFTVASTASTAFDGSQENKLEKIAIQKYLAMFPNGHEAWTEWRRTGYPKLTAVAVNNGAGEGVSVSGGIRRMKYPQSFRLSEADQANYSKNLELLGGEDKPTTQLWWDCKTRSYENL